MSGEQGGSAGSAGSAAEPQGSTTNKRQEEGSGDDGGNDEGPEKRQKSIMGDGQAAGSSTSGGGCCSGQEEHDISTHSSSLVSRAQQAWIAKVKVKIDAGIIHADKKGATGYIKDKKTGEFVNYKGYPYNGCWVVPPFPSAQRGSGERSP